MKNTSATSLKTEGITLWDHLRRPRYLFSTAPFIALFNLILLIVLASFISTLSATFLAILLLPLLGMVFGYYERWRLQTMGFGALSNNHVEFSHENLWNWIKFRYTEPASWREVLALVVSSIMGICSAILLLAELFMIGAFVGLIRITYFSDSAVTGLWLVTHQEGWYLSDQIDQLPGFSNQLLVGREWLWVLYLVITLLVFVLSPYLNGLLAATSGSISRSLLAPRPEEYERQLERISASRTTILDAFETERRRIERDLHDGVQQELVNVNMRLGIAEMEVKRLTTNGADVEVIAEHVGGARQQINHALQTLRDTVRGIYPAILETHGLRTALEDLADHTLLPVHLNYLVSEQLTPGVERAVYYVASEGLANVLKHAKASEVTLEAVSTTNKLVVNVIDNGVGGAQLDRGSGLAGLAERVATLGGELTVDSPQGGPTVLRAELPLDNVGRKH